MRFAGAGRPEGAVGKECVPPGDLPPRVQELLRELLKARLAMLYEIIGSEEDAVETYEKILEIDPAHKDAIHHLGLIRKAGDAGEAEDGG